LRVHTMVTTNRSEAAGKVIAHYEAILASKSTYRVAAKSRQFPGPLKLVSCTNAWRVDEICALIPQPNVRNG